MYSLQCYGHEYDNTCAEQYYSYYTGSEFSQDIIRQIGPQISECPCVSGLAVYLHKRKIINLTELDELMQCGTTSGRTFMLTVLLKASKEPTRGENLISELFLALLDMFCDKENSWCHHTAFYVVREQGKYINVNVQQCRQLRIGCILLSYSKVYASMLLMSTLK